MGEARGLTYAADGLDVLGFTKRGCTADEACELAGSLRRKADGLRHLARLNAQDDDEGGGE
jgi:hypothetical protein